MGCRQIEKKKPENIQTKPENTQNSSEEQKQILVNCLFEGRALIENNYNSNILLSVLVNEIENKIKKPHKNSSIEIRLNSINVNGMMNLRLGNVIGKNHQATFEVKIVGLDVSLNVLEEYSKITLFGKPLFDPFELMILNTEKLKITLDSKINDPVLSRFNLLTAYCNGQNKIFISGGENITRGGLLSNDFCEIDLITREINLNKHGLIVSRKCHSMIWIPSNYIFIVGGTETKIVEYYNITRKIIVQHSQLIEEKIEPALCLIDKSFLYAFAVSKQIPKFERINLRSGSNNWESVKVNFDNGVNFTQNFFSVSFYRNNELIFIGGTDSRPQNKTNKNFLFNYNTNLISESDQDLIDDEFNEKFFIPINHKNSILFPNFQKNNIKLLLHDESRIKEIKFELELSE